MLNTKTNTSQLSELLVKKIIQDIKQNDALSFAKYMEMALYYPNLGYYNNNLQKFGKTGDFVTAPLLGNLFANCLSTQIKEIIQKTKISHVIEVGPGTGELAKQLLELNVQQNLGITDYSLIEISSTLRQQQQQKLNKIPKIKINYYKDFSELQKDNYILIANEWLDAIPVNKFIKESKDILELCVKYNDKFTYIKKKFIKDENFYLIMEHLQKIIPRLPDGYISEFCLLLNKHLHSCFNTINSGILLFIDYGFNSREYYHPARNTGTIMCHSKQQTHPDPFFNPGLTDITSHVDFSLIARIALKANLEILGYTNLCNFLKNCNLEQHLQNNSNLNLKQQANYLCSPAEMGELFKVIALGKQLEFNLLGFKYYNQLEKL